MIEYLESKKAKPELREILTYPSSTCENLESSTFRPKLYNSSNKTAAVNFMAANTKKILRRLREAMIT